MSSTATATPTEIQEISTDKIFEVPGFNPRGDFSREDEDFLSLKSSIAERGIESPIKVGPPGEDGMHPIIFGHRRHAAAMELKLPTTPAILDEALDEKQRYLAALAENRARAEMTPIAEAKALRILRDDFGMKQADAAEALSMSERSARNRQRLLEVPESVQALVESGELPLEAVIHLAPIAAVRPKAVELIVAKGGELLKLADKGVVGLRLEQMAHDAGLQRIDESLGGFHPNSIAVDKDFRKKLRELWDGIPNPPYNKPLFRFDDEDAEKARAAGSLFEFTYERWGSKRTVQFITDPVLTFELAKLKVPAMDKKARELIKQHGKVGQVGEPDPNVAKEQERQAKEREKEEKAREKANKELTDALGALANPKATDLDIVRLLVVMALGEVDFFEEAVADGLGELLPETYGWPTDEESPHSPGLVVMKELVDAKNAGEALRVFLRVVLAYRFVNTGGGSWWGLSGPGDGDPFDAADMVDAIAERLGVVPAAAKKQVKERRKAAQEKAKKCAKERTAAEAKWKAQQEEKAAAVESEGEGRAEKALELIKATPGITAADIAKEMGIKPNFLYRILGELIEQGKVSKDGRKYTVVEKA